MDWNDTITGLAVCLFGSYIAFTHLKSYSTVPTCSSGTLTNVLPHRNAMPQTQDMTPHPVTVYRPVSIHCCGTSHWNNTTTHFNVSGQTQSRKSKGCSHTTVFDLITAPALITALPWLLTLFSLIIAHLTIFFLTFYFIFTYYRPLDDLLALVVENKFT